MHQTAEHAPLTPQEHLDLDWSLFQDVEDGAAGRLYRIWETARPVVVLGRSTSAADHLVEAACRADDVPVLRRFTGGGAVVLGPGCLNYAVAVPLVSCPALVDVRESFRVLLGRIAAALDVPGLSIEGGTDLALDGRKVSGNAQRRGRRALIQHGTLLVRFDAGLAARYLKDPPRQPAYRAGRAHEDFIGNVPLSIDTARARLAIACAAPLPRCAGSEDPAYN